MTGWDEFIFSIDRKRTANTSHGLTRCYGREITPELLFMIFGRYLFAGNLRALAHTAV
jgi:hypothetical protein